MSRTYDQWKTDFPEDNKIFKCQECLKPIEKEGYCSTACYKASLL